MMPTDPATDPILGEEGYPSEDELARIREWPWEGGFRSLMDYVHRRWWTPEFGWRQQGDRFRLATGGWSGNESLIGALEDNWMFQSLCAESWHKGGLYIYDVQEWDDNPDKGKRVLVRDPATPLDEHDRVPGCDHLEAAPPSKKLLGGPR